MVGIDDLGTPGGHIELPFGAEADRLLNQWDFRAFGNRPQDFASYDAIVGSARRDWRNEHLTELSKNGHPRFANALRRATRAQQKRALASVAWLWTLYRSLAVTLKDFDSPVLRQATICPPPLALVLRMLPLTLMIQMRQIISPLRMLPLTLILLIQRIMSHQLM